MKQLPTMSYLSGVFVTQAAGASALQKRLRVHFQQLLLLITPSRFVFCSLKALVLEELWPKNNAELARTYWKLIQMNPSSISSLEALLVLHNTGMC